MTKMEELDEFDMTALAATMLSAANTAAQQREAILLWLKGARLQVSPSEAHSETGPADFLIAALEALGDGHAMPLLKPAPVKTASKVARDAAIARAIAALDYLIARSVPLDVAGPEIDKTIGVKIRTTQRWRETANSARKLHKSAAAKVKPTLDNWIFLDSLSPELLPGEAETAILLELVKDRPIHVAG